MEHHNESHPISYEAKFNDMDHSRSIMWLTLETGNRNLFPVLENPIQMVTPKQILSQRLTGSTRSLSEVRSAHLFLMNYV